MPTKGSQKRSAVSTVQTTTGASAVSAGQQTTTGASAVSAGQQTTDERRRARMARLAQFAEIMSAPAQQVVEEAPAQQVVEEAPARQVVEEAPAQAAAQAQSSAAQRRSELLTALIAPKQSDVPTELPWEKGLTIHQSRRGTQKAAKKAKKDKADEAKAAEKAERKRVAEELEADMLAAAKEDAEYKMRTESMSVLERYRERMKKLAAERLRGATQAAKAAKYVRRTFVSKMEKGVVLEWELFERAAAAAPDIKETTKFKTLKAVLDAKRDDAKPHAHQVQLIEMCIQHLEKHDDPMLKDLLIAYQAQTGSGKTFAFLLLAKEIVKRFKDVTIVMTAPRYLLYRAISECEALQLPYWNVAATSKQGDATNEVYYTVKRPVSLKQQHATAADDVDVPEENVEDATQEEKRKAAEKRKQEKTKQAKSKGKPYATTVTHQMWQSDRKSHNEGSPRPRVLLCDVIAAAKLFSELKNPHKPSEHAPEVMPSWVNREKMVLFMDEPNFGILNERVLDCVRTVLSNKPGVTVLASATLGNWDTIPEWWQGSGGQLDVIRTGTDFEHAALGLNLFQDDLHRVHKISPLSLCESHDQVKENVEQLNQRQLDIVARYFSRKQRAELTGSERRQDLMQLLANPPEDVLTVLPADKTGTSIKSLRDVLSATGLTFVAALNPSTFARRLCGVSDDKFLNELNAVKAKMNTAKNSVDAQKQEKDRANAKKGKLKEGEEKADERDKQTYTSEQVFGKVRVSNSDLASLKDNVDINAFVLLSYGILVITPESPDFMQELFQRSVLDLQEKMLKQRATGIHTIVTDYNGIFGIDCPAIFRVIIDEQIAELLEQDDLTQAIGRIRGDGDVVVMSAETACKMFAFPEVNIPRLVSVKVADALNTMPYESVDDQEKMVEVLTNTSFAGVFYTREEILFQILLELSERQDFYQLVGPWFSGLFADDDNDFSKTGKFMRMFAARITQNRFPLKCLDIMRNTLRMIHTTKVVVEYNKDGNETEEQDAIRVWCEKNFSAPQAYALNAFFQLTPTQKELAGKSKAERSAVKMSNHEEFKRQLGIEREAGEDVNWKPFGVAAFEEMAVEEEDEEDARPQEMPTERSVAPRVPRYFHEDVDVAEFLQISHADAFHLQSQNVPIYTDGAFYGSLVFTVVPKPPEP